MKTNTAVLCTAALFAAAANAGTVGKPTVYFTSEITPESLVKVFDALGVAPSASDRVAVKISTGEAGGNNYLKPELISNLVAHVNGTLVECNTAYRKRRHTSEEHWKTIREHGFTGIAKVELMDEFGETEIPVRDRAHIAADLVGAGLTNYTFMVNLAHFKGHAMGGFGGVLKNQSIGVASANGKARIHSAGATDDTAEVWDRLPAQDAFLESMAAAAQAVHDRFGAGRIVYVNVLNNLSVDCDCSSHPAAPKMKDLGVMASLDPVALDQAAVDMVTGVPVNDGDDNRDLLKRIEDKHGVHIIEHAEKIGLGSRAYTLVRIDLLDKPGETSSVIEMTLEAAIGMIRRGDAECIVMKPGSDGTLRLETLGRGRGIAPFLDILDSRERGAAAEFEKLAFTEKAAAGAPEKPLSGCTVADKIIGRAAAFIAIRGGVKAVHGEIMCEGAEELLEKHGIETTCTLLVPQIRDRSFGRLCPLEDSVSGIDDPDRALTAMRARIAALRAGEKITTPELPEFPRVLVAYHSRGGNTRFAAETIARAIGADVFEIRPFAPYPEDGKACTAAVKAEQAAGARPPLLPGPVDFGAYDTVFVGSPVWCGKIAPPVATFLSSAGLDGKKIVPFFTHGGGGADGAAADFAEKFKSAETAGAGSWKAADLKSSAEAIAEWARAAAGLPQNARKK